MKELFSKACKKIKQLHDAKMSEEEIVKVIKDSKFPLGVELRLMGNYSEIVKLGRPLTKRERSVGLR